MWMKPMRAAHSLAQALGFYATRRRRPPSGASRSATPVSQSQGCYGAFVAADAGSASPFLTVARPASPAKRKA